MTTAALFVTCLVDQLFPWVGEASVRLLEEAGCRVVFPAAQTCCGQPVFNLGHRAEARRLARRFVETFEPYDVVIAPSGSCSSMTRVFALDLLTDEVAWRSRAESLAARSYELSEFLWARDFRPSARFDGRVAYHASCHLLRELGVVDAPKALLARVAGLDLVPLTDAERCCGFGGAFSVEQPDLSMAILDAKLAALEASGAEVVTASDTGCLMHMAGALRRRGSRLRAVHLAELLAGTSVSDRML